MSIFKKLFGFGKDKSIKESSENMEAQPIAIPVEHIVATKEQIERRAKSEDFCKSYNIPVYKNPNALFVDAEEDVTLRTQDEVVDRALALCYLGLKSEELEQVHLDKFDLDFNIKAKLTDEEKRYAYGENTTEKQQTNANWRYESLHLLLWALSYIDDLSYPEELCNVADDVTIIYELKEQKFRAQAKLRTKKEILDQADLILRLNWACVSARIKNEASPSGLNSSIVYERHYSLNWLIQLMNQDWDDVTTDT